MKKNSKTKLSEPVSIVAHQLKNPISVLNGCLEMLLSGEIGEINDKQREYLQDAMENVGNMTRIVKDILDVSRIEGGKYEINPKPVDLLKISQKVISDFSSLSKASNCKITVDYDNNLPLVFVDPQKVRLVIENLISNSLKYKSAGPGKIEIRLEKKNKKVIFSCKDNGISIKKEDIDKVFSKFYRSEEAIKLDPSGTGLGLYLSKAIVELNGGKIWFEKNKGKGITFYFSLPISPSI